MPKPNVGAGQQISQRRSGQGHGTGVSVHHHIGFVFGMIARYGPKLLYALIVLLFETLRLFRTVMSALAVVALVGPRLNTVIIVIMITSIPAYGRVVRTLTQSLKLAKFVTAERALGATALRIMAVHTKHARSKAPPRAPPHLRCNGKGSRKRQRVRPDQPGRTCNALAEKDSAGQIH